eukprot:scaffold16712_cov65-Phaeocystis_antarctica.AAC.22
MTSWRASKQADADALSVMLRLGHKWKAGALSVDGLWKVKALTTFPRLKALKKLAESYKCTYEYHYEEHGAVQVSRLQPAALFATPPPAAECTDALHLRIGRTIVQAGVAYERPAVCGDGPVISFRRGMAWRRTPHARRDRAYD